MVAGLTTAACGARAPLVLRSGPQTSSHAERRAPGVVPEPTSTLPPPRPEASPERGLVVLRAPANVGRAIDAVRAFFRAVESGDSGKLDALIHPLAWVTTGSQGRLLARSFWRTRLSRLDYRSSDGRLAFQPSEVDVYRAGAPPPPRASGKPIRLAPAGDDVVVRVRIASPAPGQTRLFGDEVVFLLHPAESGYQITEMAEDFQLP
ncbi:MAG: hypothetical protein OZ921_02525 [Sorangiineae bacterium]|nr:hypothetical protein [Polyangiaceae bacterium]MEB2321361.1 hypothetical protein [Sorangiineae bacterium]